MVERPGWCCRRPTTSIGRRRRTRFSAIARPALQPSSPPAPLTTTSSQRSRLPSDPLLEKQRIPDSLPFPRPLLRRARRRPTLPSPLRRRHPPARASPCRKPAQTPPLPEQQAAAAATARSSVRLLLPSAVASAITDRLRLALPCRQNGEELPELASSGRARRSSCAADRPRRATLTPSHCLPSSPARSSPSSSVVDAAGWQGPAWHVASARTAATAWCVLGLASSCWRPGRAGLRRLASSGPG